MVEKDFAFLDRSDGDNQDTFTNPNAGGPQLITGEVIRDQSSRRRDSPGRTHPFHHRYVNDGLRFFLDRQHGLAPHASHFMKVIEGSVSMFGKWTVVPMAGIDTIVAYGR
jgi:hypothetical protein